MRRRAALGAISAVALSALGASLAGAQPRVVRITARKFAFEPNQVTLRSGEPVVLEFTAADVTMGFNAPDLGLRADLVPGQKVRVPLTPARAGTYEYYCDIFCGDGHESMRGSLKVI